MPGELCLYGCGRDLSPIPTGIEDMDTYRFTRLGCPGVFTIDAPSAEDAKRAMRSFFTSVLSDRSWVTTVHIESSMGCEELPEPSDEDVEEAYRLNSACAVA